MEYNNFSPYLANLSCTINVLKKFKFKFKKKYGQNFLIDKIVVEKIINSSGLTKDDTVLEIGAGIGTLTQYLSIYSRDVVAVEIDKNLIPILEDTLKCFNNVTIIHGDILKQDIKLLVNGCKNKTLVLNNKNKCNFRFHVIANLPYYITTPIIIKLLEQDMDIQSITVMVQSEAADRISAKIGSKDYGAVSLIVQYYAVPVKILKVSPACFIPRPCVNSTVLLLKKYDRPIVTVVNKDFMFKIIRGAFAYRRKTMTNSLASAGINGVTKTLVEKVLIQMNLSVHIRGEELTLNQFAKISNILYRKCVI